MSALPRRIEFTLETGDWQPWPGAATEVELLLASLPSTAIVGPDAARTQGLPKGERALAAAATARLLGCRHLAGAEARQAAAALKRQREVLVLLEEGLPSPLTGRLGAVITAAGTLGKAPVAVSRAALWRLEEEKLDDQEIVDLILTAAIANWTARLTLALGRPAKG